MMRNVSSGDASNQAKIFSGCLFHKEGVCRRFGFEIPFLLNATPFVYDVVLHCNVPFRLSKVVNIKYNSCSCFSNLQFDVQQGGHVNVSKMNTVQKSGCTNLLVSVYLVCMLVVKIPTGVPLIIFLWDRATLFRCRPVSFCVAREHA